MTKPVPPIAGVVYREVDTEGSQTANSGADEEKKPERKQKNLIRLRIPKGQAYGLEQNRKHPTDYVFS